MNAPQKQDAAGLGRFDLSGRCALVTGSSRGIGAALAVGLAEAGADVVVHYAGREQAAKQVAQRICDLGRRAAAARSDLADPRGPDQLRDAAIQAMGHIDILICNASVQLPEPWRDISREHFQQQLAVNFYATFRLMQLFAPDMVDRGWGRMLTIGSVQEVKPHPDMLIYAGTKAAQTSMVGNLAVQLAEHGVTVNNLAPGVILTDRSTDRLTDPQYRQTVLQRIPVRRFGQSEDCVGAALLLCSDAGGYITGQSLLVDGGMSLK